MEFKPKAYQPLAENTIRRGQTYKCCDFQSRNLIETLDEYEH